MASIMNEPSMNGTEYPPEQKQQEERLPDSEPSSSYANGIETEKSHEPTQHEAIASSEDQTRRKSGRVRTSTQFYTGEPIRPKPIKPKQGKHKSKKKNSDANSSAKTKSKASDSKKGKVSKDKSKSKSSPFVISLKLPQHVPPPSFLPIESVYPDDIVWLKLNIREFFLRFDKLCRLPTRHGSTINDPTCEWNEYLYKSLIVNLLRIILNDTVPQVTYTRDYLSEMEKTPADSERMWNMLNEFIDLSQIPPTQDQIEEQKIQDEFVMDRARLIAITRLLLIAAGSETIRLTVDDDQLIARKVQLETQEEIKKLKTQLEAQMNKLNKTKPTQSGPELEKWQEKYSSAKKSNTAKIQHAEDTAYFKYRKLNMRSFCLGKDTFGNHYWIFQQKSKDISSWGSWVICDKHPSIVHPSGESGVDYSIDPKTRIFCVNGKEEVQKLAKWIQSQYKAKTSLPIVKELQKFASHLNDPKLQGPAQSL